MYRRTHNNLVTGGAEECFSAMMRHATRGKSLPASETGRVVYGEEHFILAEVAWGAEEVAAAMMGVSSDPKVNARRRRRVFNMHEKYQEAVREAKANQRPLPPNPLGWLSLPFSNRIVLCLRTYRAFIASQLNGGRHG